jgi:hypothetical protein
MIAELNKSKVSTISDLHLIAQSQEDPWFTRVSASKSVHSIDYKTSEHCPSTKQLRKLKTAQR